MRKKILILFFFLQTMSLQSVATNIFFGVEDSHYQLPMNKDVVLKKDIPISQQLNESNTRYVVKSNFTLDKDVTIPDNCVLSFDGGKIDGTHAITFKNTLINASATHIISAKCSGHIKNDDIYPEWFCNSNDFTNAIITSIDIAKGTGASIIFTAEKYLIRGGQITFKSNLRFYSPNKSTIYTKDATNYKAMFYCGKNAPDNVTFDNITFDQSLQESTTNIRGLVNMHCILAYTSTNLTVSNCKFISVGTNCIHVNGDKVRNTKIINNDIVFIRLKNIPDYDNSSMYILDDYHEIINNYVHGERQHGGIETHGPKGYVTNNRIENCNSAINICAGIDSPKPSRIISENEVSDCDDFCAFWQYDYLPPIRNVQISNNYAENIKQAITSVITNEQSGADMFDINIFDNVFIGNYHEFESNKNHQQYSAVYIAAVGAIFNMHIYNNIFCDFPLHILTSNIWNSTKMKSKQVSFDNNKCINCFNSKAIEELRMYYSLFFIGGLIDINIHHNTFEYNDADRNTGLYALAAVSTGTGNVNETRKISFLNNKVPERYAALYYSDNSKNNLIVEDIDQLYKTNTIKNNLFKENKIPQHIRKDDVIIKGGKRFRALNNGSYHSIQLDNPRITVTNPYFCYITAKNISDIKCGDILYCETNGDSNLPKAFSGHVSFVSNQRIYMYSTSLPHIITNTPLRKCSTLQAKLVEVTK